MAGPHVYLSLPQHSFIPDAQPLALPPVGDGTFKAPFTINPELYHFILRPEVPIVFASVYVVSVFFLNAYNADRKEKNGGVAKPWWIARQQWYHYFVVAHNALLVLYSFVTFLALFRAALHTWPGYSHDTGLAGLADAFCKMSGPRGFGDAATFNTTINIWESKNSLIKLARSGTPDPTDVGRLWNEGLAFWGWWFYVSKFYEVIDTLIILAKGKRSPTLQTYHHSGAMLCMWAGIRYMSPPIWMFVFVNSFIHTLMYVYFTLSALEIKVPVALKRTLTTLQIIQLLWGSFYAGTHLFLQYDIPIATPYQIAAVVKSAVASVSSAASVATSTISEIIATPTPTGDLVALAKKLLLRAVGEEGIAELVTDRYGKPLVPAIESKIEQIREHALPQYETRWQTSLTKVNCLDTSGQAFAIYLNLLYLTPLTFLFLRFFVKAYTGDGGKPRNAADAARRTLDAGKQAGKKTHDAVETAGQKAEEEARKSGKSVQEQLRKDLDALKKGTYERGRRVSDQVQDFERQVKAAADEAQERLKRSTTGGSSGSGSRRSSPTKSSPIARQNESAVEDDEKTYAEVAAEPPTAASDALAVPSDEGEDKENQPPPPSSSSSSSPSQPAAAQEATLAATQPTRPGLVGESASSGGVLTESKILGAEEDDTDAMGKSGALVDFAAEKAKEVKDKTKEAAEEVKESAKEVKESAEKKVEEVKEAAKQ